MLILWYPDFHHNTHSWVPGGCGDMDPLSWCSNTEVETWGGQKGPHVDVMCCQYNSPYIHYSNITLLFYLRSRIIWKCKKRIHHTQSPCHLTLLVCFQAATLCPGSLIFSTGSPTTITDPLLNTKLVSTVNCDPPSESMSVTSAVT